MSSHAAATRGRVRLCRRPCLLPTIALLPPLLPVEFSAARHPPLPRCQLCSTPYRQCIRNVPVNSTPQEAARVLREYYPRTVFCPLSVYNRVRRGTACAAAACLRRLQLSTPTPAPLPVPLPHRRAAPPLPPRACASSTPACVARWGDPPPNAMQPRLVQGISRLCRAAGRLLLRRAAARAGWPVALAVAVAACLLLA